MDKNKLILPITILAASIILGGFFYAGQINMKRFIAQELKIKAQIDSQAEQARAEKEQTDKLFNNYIKCQTLFVALKQKWNNMVDIYYNEAGNNCIVKYTVNDETEEAPFEEMRDIN